MTEITPQSLRNKALVLADAALDERAPLNALEYLRVLDALPPDSNSKPGEAESLDEAAETVSRLAAHLALAMLHGPETAPAVFAEQVQAWRTVHLAAVPQPAEPTD